jgi:hypothetical protein
VILADFGTVGRFPLFECCCQAGVNIIHEFCCLLEENASDRGRV